MADETTQDTADKPLAHIAEVERESAAPEPMTAPQRLRAYEDALFGEDCVRIRGQVERGYGSKFKDMTAPQAAHYAALEKLVGTEQRLADAQTALIDAESAHEAALADADCPEADIDASAHE